MVTCWLHVAITLYGHSHFLPTKLHHIMQHAILTTLNMIFRVSLYLTLLPPYVVQHEFSIPISVKHKCATINEEILEDVNM